ncbi:DUF2306 domain-containing protein [Croceitalea marina]|uniref:DUF2306 domain-containing protein n=1 Tax=Croceitalea marina TaxID=1775166 RepID=A0ABW5MZU9_9FLAO
MKKLATKTIWAIFVLSCILIGLYPLIYFLIEVNFGLLALKSKKLLENVLWNNFFYGHIIFGGISLLIGWTQFSPKLRRKRLALHRLVGKVYVLCVLISGVCGIYIAQFATGGITNIIAFNLSALIWLITTIAAYKAIKKRKIKLHENYMIYSYAVCFSAVTLRIWLPILTEVTGSFDEAYLIGSWLSWVPNLLVAFFIIKMKNLRFKTSV